MVQFTLLSADARVFCLLRSLAAGAAVGGLGAGLAAYSPW